MFTTVPALADLGPWLDLQTAQSALSNGGFGLAADQVARIGVPALIWIVLPFVAGWLRVLRAAIT